MCYPYKDNIQEDITDLDFSPLSSSEKLLIFLFCIMPLASAAFGLLQLFSDRGQSPKESRGFLPVLQVEAEIPRFKGNFPEQNRNEHEQLENLIERRNGYAVPNDCTQAWLLQQNDYPCLNKWQTNF